MSLPEIEISEIPALTAHEQALLELHSVLNLLGVLTNELAALGGRLAGDADLCRAGVAAAEALGERLRADPAQVWPASWLEPFARTVCGELEAKAAALPDPAAGATALAEVRSLLAVLAARVRELDGSAAATDGWDVFFVEELQAEFAAVLATMERIARGRFRILVNQPRRLPSDYCVRFRFVADRGATIWMPRALKAVIRDLVANARKYTPPGGTITADLSQTGGALHFAVTDNGRGIPPDDLARVVHFGRRGSNVADVRSLGGGFGLTKAFAVTRRHGGRFWIASALGQGTRVRLSIPRPVPPALRHG